MWQQVWGKQVVVTVAAAIAVEDNDAHDNVDPTEMDHRSHQIQSICEYLKLGLNWMSLNHSI